MNNGHIGKIAESLAIARFLEKGYEIYMGWGNTSCDFIIYKPHEIPKRVEVKKRSPDKYKPTADPSKYDILCVVDTDTNTMRMYNSGE